MPATPCVLFVCVKNGGKSQMAAALMTRAAGDAVVVSSAGTHPGATVNALSAQVLAEVGIDITANTPTALTPDMVAAADLVVVLGRDAQVPEAEGTTVEIWNTDEPSDRGIEGVDRMRLVRDDIAASVQQLSSRLRSGPLGRA